MPLIVSAVGVPERAGVTGVFVGTDGQGPVHAVSVVMYVYRLISTTEV